MLTLEAPTPQNGQTLKKLIGYQQIVSFCFTIL